MRFVAIKTERQQAAAGMHKVREMLVKQRTMLTNQIRGLMAEFGIVTATGTRHFGELVAQLAIPDDQRVPAPLRQALLGMAEVLRAVTKKIEGIEQEIVAAGGDDATYRHLITAPGYGPILSSAMAAMVVDPAVFRGAGDFSASLGLVPRQEGTGGRINPGVRPRGFSLLVAASFRARGRGGWRGTAPCRAGR